MGVRVLATVVFCVCCLLQSSAQRAAKQPSLESLFHKANHYFNQSSPTRVSDAKALSLYGAIIEAYHQNHSLDDILFQSYIKQGVLLDVQGNHAEALASYEGAQDCWNRHPGWSDSLLFKVLIYAGPDYYIQGNFDAAYEVLNRAEVLAEKFPQLPDRDRLYNSLGALYYESGNYLQSKNYFSRALDIVEEQRPDDEISLVNFQSNIASCLYKLGEYQQALATYDQLLEYGKASNELYFNVGKSYAAIGDYVKAMINFRKVAASEVPGVLNEMAYAKLMAGDVDSGFYYLNLWQTSIDVTQRTKIDSGINELYLTQALCAKAQYDAALTHLQQAIITFSGTFKNSDVHTDPKDFVGAFASYRLFDALSYKALLTGSLFKKYDKEEYLQESLSAYNSAITLFRYIEKTYATDDAKLFLKKNNQDLYQNAVLAYLELYRLHPNGPYLEQAFITAEKSKSSIVEGRLSELALARLPGIDPAILKKQKEIKYNIARAELKNDAQTGNPDKLGMANQKSDYEIELSRLQKDLEQNNQYYRTKFGDDCPTVSQLQGKLAANQAIVSLFISKQGLHIFLITHSTFNYLFADSLSKISSLAQGWINILNSTSRGQRFNGRELGSQLSLHLLEPIRSALKGKDEWIIIPDGIFYLLPFESLPVDEEGHPLLESTTISYQLSSKFLSEPFLQREEKKFQGYAVLSFAPFAAKAEWVKTQPQKYLAQLPHSAEEIENLPGRQYLNEQATKEVFLREANHYPVIHLATHAVADAQSETGSFIWFFPANKDLQDNCLFLPELYGLVMDSTNLVILSACESGRGALVDNEGLMSLSRGFMYAGCGSTVNSLWKADDESTAFILSAFHKYLEKGYAKSTALRQAKLDYMHSGALYVTPNYWSHLILIGNTEAVVGKKERSWITICLLGLGLISLLLIWRARLAFLNRSTP